MSPTRTFLKPIRTKKRLYTINISNRKFVWAYRMMKGYSTVENVQLLTNSNDIAIFLVQFRIIEILLSTKRAACKVKFGEFAKDWSRIFGERVPGRDSVGQDRGDESRPEKAEHFHGC